MSCYSPVNSALRSLDILVVLNRQRVCTLDHIHKHTGLPKSTIVRFLETLVKAGYVAKEEWDKGYRVTSQVTALSCGFHGGPMVVEAGRPWALALTRVHRWPAAIAVPDGEAVMICYTTAPEAAVTPYHAIIHKRLGLVSKALGRAFLSFCPPEERAMTMRLLETTEHPDSALMRAPGSVEQLIATDRREGFSERVATATPEASSSVAVPIYQPGSQTVIATIGLTYYASAVSRKQIVETYVPQLQSASRAIGDSIARMTTALEAERAAVA
ncbi:helix-turn-helix domain-containing protein [Psychromarinibacter sp. C21-152]|uniref:Helix-turn-helix domain-containing protein n=1 Tax=Psychromarinibacter sediminicola TaxID=3033385 RepID=A0AAE3NQ95_9RHOB|nr:helix-turn-helix domain-containing protein [Psychromarinibacter sediminicola]MDF0600441.1 helix-turn-helix domain-containing protein [Psychromarinibacter sediminicola]